METSNGKIIISGGKPLYGTIPVSGMKNAAVAILLSTILTEDKCVIENLPDISDVNVSLQILESIGVKVTKPEKNVAIIDCTDISPRIPPYELVSRMRASYYLIGAELGRFGRAFVGLPGGCDFGVRPIDQHVKGFEALGCDVKVDGGYIEATAPDGKLRASSVYMDVVTVGGTINVMLAAVRAEGVTVIENAAREPHIVDTANFLNACGADISGAGTDVIKIRGVKRLHSCNYTLIPDQIETGTWMIIAAATRSDILIRNCIPTHMESLSAKLAEAGFRVEEGEDTLRILPRTARPRAVRVKTMVYPGFPTDLQQPFSALLSVADGTSVISETIFEQRFRHLDELQKMGGRSEVTDRTAVIEGVERLYGTYVEALDLRGGAALIVAGLIADGTTVISGVHYIDRGYERIVEKLQALGADIERIEE